MPINMTPVPPEHKSPKFSAALDLVRGIASCLVLAAHILQLFLYPFLPKGAVLSSVSNHLAVFSVLIFFVLSGYLITGSLIQNYRRNGEIDEWQFLRARIERIVPPFLAAILLTLCAAVVIRWLGMPAVEPSLRAGVHVSIGLAGQLKAKAVIPTALLSNGLIPGSSTIPCNLALWSLSIEVWLYVIALMVAVAITRIGTNDGRQTAIVALAIITLCLSGNARFWECAIYWGLGSLFAAVKSVPSLRRTIRMALAVLMVAGAAEALIFFAKIWPLERYLPTLIPVKMAILIAMTGLFQMLVPRIPDVVLKLGKKLAASSYTLYILHFPVLLLIFALTWEHYTAFQASAKALFLTATFITVWFLCHAAARYLEDRRRWAWLFGGAAR